LEETIFLARKLGVHEVIVFNVVPTGRLLHNKDVILTPEENELVWDLFVKYNEVAPPKIYNIRKSLKIGCFGARHTLHVTSYGHVTPCPFAPISFGNVRRETIKEIWRRMGESKSFKGRQDACRMQDPSFRAKYISRIPEGAFLPYPIEKIEYK
jgi:MoaA/NifB/PqqE/SkfB family radical SAM enzyme